MDDTFIPIAAYEADLNGPFPPSGSFQWVKTYHPEFLRHRPRGPAAALPAVQPPQQTGDLEALNGFNRPDERRRFPVLLQPPLLVAAEL